jgi:hypothetical protein
MKPSRPIQNRVSGSMGSIPIAGIFLIISSNEVFAVVKLNGSVASDAREMQPNEGRTGNKRATHLS